MRHLSWTLRVVWEVTILRALGGVGWALALGVGVGCGLRRLMRLCSYGTCFVFGLFALPLSGAGLTFFAAAKKVSKESSGE
ncbi:hypothetical protein, partial [Caballeronia choica]|uniref:hypothetical protein n=1 Tax=Caballeronia choica TaxID=326476 RepID=UPI001177EC72